MPLYSIRQPSFREKKIKKIRGKKTPSAIQMAGAVLRGQKWDHGPPQCCSQQRPASLCNGSRPSSSSSSSTVREQRVGDNSFRRWEKQVDQSETTLFPPITAFRSSQQRNFPDNHEGPSTIQRLPTGSPPHHRHVTPPAPGGNC